jgi:type IV fimbrial biogenesis protein FimT
MRQRGMTLIEVAVVMAIGGILLASGMPALTDYLTNSRLRSVAQEMREGLAIARNEAIRRNTNIEFVPNGTGWTVVRPARDGLAALTISTRTPVSDERNITATASAARATFTGIGRLATGPFSVHVAPLVEACQADGGEARCLDVNVGIGGNPRMCDPALPGTHHAGC